MNSMDAQGEWKISYRQSKRENAQRSVGIKIECKSHFFVKVLYINHALLQILLYLKKPDIIVWTRK